MLTFQMNVEFSRLYYELSVILNFSTWLHPQEDFQSSFCEHAEAAPTVLHLSCAAVDNLPTEKKISIHTHTHTHTNPPLFALH